MQYEIRVEIDGLVEEFDFKTVAKQANSAVLARVNNTVMLATVVYDLDSPVNEDFLPLTVQYIEKSYAGGKFPGGFIKRESKPGDFETLTARIVDRSLRPLFPSGFCYPVVINVLVLSCDDKTDLQVMALNTASSALYASELPIKKCVCATRVAKIDGELKLNPTLQELSSSTLDLFVTGYRDDILMIEQRSIATLESENVFLPSDGIIGITPIQSSLKKRVANELSEESLIDALNVALTHIKEKSIKYEETFNTIAKPQKELPLLSKVKSVELYEYLKKEHFTQINLAVNRMSKSERMSELKGIAKDIAKLEPSIQNQWSKEAILEEISEIKREIIRNMAVNDKKRADGRGLKDVRPISILTNILPQAHGSALFTRGQTQALVVSTIGGDMDAQSYELLSEKGGKKEKFMVHYNFPSFSVGEAQSIGAPGRRELGHGNLAKRALEPVLLDSRTVRLVSEILESNGSSSMATVCGGSLALLSSGVPIITQVAGVAMGLIKEDNGHAVLSDIMGLEDHDGDMDCKIAGTINGITAMQMDIKLGGLDFAILKEVLYQAKEAREHILSIMEKAASEITLNESILPSMETFLVSPSKIVEIIGQAGKTIKEIIERFEVAIDLDRASGEVKVTGKSKERVNAASEHIKSITGKEDGAHQFNPASYEAGEVFSGKVKKIVDFGAFVELPKGGDGLIHISKLGEGRVSRVSDVLKEGDEIEVKILSITKNRVELAPTTLFK